MKKFRILGIIAIIAMVANLAINFEDGWSSFLKGYHEGARSHKTIPNNLYRVSLEVMPTEETTFINTFEIHFIHHFHKFYIRWTIIE